MKKKLLLQNFVPQRERGLPANPLSKSDVQEIGDEVLGCAVLKQEIDFDANRALGGETHRACRSKHDISVIRDQRMQKRYRSRPNIEVNRNFIRLLFVA